VRTAREDLLAQAGIYEKAKAPIKSNGAAHLPLIRSSATFVATFTPPDYLIDGILQRRFIYSLTGQTGAGKTALMLLLAASVALGRPIGDRNVEKGRALYLAGENPADVQMRWIAMAQQYDFEIDEIDVNFIPGVFKISEAMEQLHDEVEAIGGITSVLVDTSSAYNEGDTRTTTSKLATTPACCAA
jgi:RecA-family ATPase